MTSSPNTKRRVRGRRLSRRCVICGSIRLGRPEPIRTAATVSWSRSSARGEEARHRDAAAFDEQAREPALGEHAADRMRIELASRARQAQDFGLTDGGLVARRIFADQHERRRRPVAKHALTAVETPLRIDHHPYGIRSRAAPHRQLRIVVQHRVDAHDDRIEERTHAMHVEQVLGTAQPLRDACVRGDAPVQALREMRDDVALAAGPAQRLVEAAQHRCVGSRRFAEPAEHGPPARIVAARHGCRSVRMRTGAM